MGMDRLNGVITKVERVTDGDKPPGSTYSRPFAVEGLGTTGAFFIEITPEAAEEFKQRLAEHLSSR